MIHGPHRSAYRICQFGSNQSLTSESAAAEFVVFRTSEITSIDDRGLHRASNMPGVIKNDELTNENVGPLNLERSRTERRRQNNPAGDPTKQLFDENIPIKKKMAPENIRWGSAYQAVPNQVGWLASDGVMAGMDRRSGRFQRMGYHASPKAISLFKFNRIDVPNPVR